MALTFIDGQKNEFFTILNLFKSDDKTVHGLAYTLLSKRLNEMSEQALNHKYIIQLNIHFLKLVLQTIVYVV